LLLAVLFLFMIVSQRFEGRDEFSSEIVHCGEEDCSPGHEFGGMRPYYLLHIIREGQGDFYCSGRRWHLSKGDAFLIFPETRNLYRADWENPWNYFWLAFKGDYRSMLSALNLNPENPVLHSSDVESLYDRYRPISNKSKERHPGEILEISANLKMILSELFKERRLVKSYLYPVEDVKADHVKSMRNFIDAYYNTPIKVSDIINFVNLERTYAAKIFKNETGLSLGQLLKESRLNQADKYLREGWSVKETAYSVGYKDYENFLKTYKRSRGMTPGEFRKRALSDI